MNYINKNVIYVGYYSVILSVEKRRICSLAAKNLMDYIASILKNSNSFKIISPSWIDNIDNENNYVKWIGSMKTKNEFGVEVHFPPSPLRTSARIQNLLAKIVSQIWLLIKLILKTDKKSIVITYHSPNLLFPILIAKRIVKFQLILQVCEIYSDVSKDKWLLNWMEKKLISIADSYLFSTKILSENRIFKNKKYVVCSGIYRNELMNSLAHKKNDDGSYRIIYSGVIDCIKKGAFNAIEAGLYLNEKYTLFVCGFGERHDIEELLKRIAIIKDKTKCNIVFKGELVGQDYVNFLESCHIGLSTQTNLGEFNETSFPAKIFTYLASGLAVVSINTKSIKSSPISSVLTFYEGTDPSLIAQAIKKSIRHINSDLGRQTLEKMHTDFQRQFITLINQDLTPNN